MTIDPDTFEQKIAKYRAENAIDPRANYHAGPGRFFAVDTIISYNNAVEAVLRNEKCSQ